MSQEKEKWLTNQLLDLFENSIQIRPLNPVIVGYVKEKPVILKSPKFTPALRLILLIIAKYPQCYMGKKRFENATGLSNRNLKKNIKFLAENGIITVELRQTDVGDNDSNLYKICIEKLFTHFSQVGTKQPQGWGRNSPPGRDETAPPVGTNRPPIYKKGFNKSRESTRKKRASLSADFLPSKANADLLLQTASKTRSTPEFLMKKFKNCQRSTGKVSADWDAELENFLLNERPSLQLTKSSVTNEVKSTLQYIAPAPRKESDREFARKSAREIIGKLKGGLYGKVETKS
jgi:hypothetical protein